MNIKLPTPDQCSGLEKVFEDDDKIGYAVWYPQMGGYVGRAVALFDKEWQHSEESGCSIGGCIEIYVWHDGEFPFSDDGERAQQPAHLHHCDPEQFIAFGKKLKEINDKGKRPL
jgi:hypothetical protein